MKKLIVDDKIVLIPMTSQLYHIERKNYIAEWERGAAPGSGSRVLR